MTSGFASSRTATASTPNRKTHIRFDVDERVLLEPVFSQNRYRSQIQPPRGGAVNVNDTVLGWQLTLSQANITNTNELAARTADSAELTVPSGFSQKARFAKSDLPGASYIPAVPATGDLFWSRDFVAGTSVTDSQYALQSDQSHFPTATLGEENCPMLRIGLGIAGGLLGSDNPNTPYSFRFNLPGISSAAPDNILTWYWYGPAGGNHTIRGTGYHCITFHGDGSYTIKSYAEIVNSGIFDWIEQQTGFYCAPDQAVGHTHRCVIAQTTRIPNNSRAGGIIIMSFTTSDFPAQTLDGKSKGISAGTNQTSNQGNTSTTPSSFTALYVIPKCPFQLNPTPQPVRIDGRADSSVEFQIAIADFAPSGTLQEGNFQLNFLPFSNKPFVIGIDADIPSGTSLTAQVFDADTDLPLSGNIPTAGKRFFYVVFTFTSDGATTPTLYGYQITRDGTADIVSPGEFEVPFAATPPNLRTGSSEGMQLSGFEMDPSHESASFGVHDLGDVMPRLQKRGELSCVVEVEDLITHERVKLFRGYAINQIGEQLDRGKDIGSGVGDVGPSAYGISFHRRYPITAMGMWARLKERLVDFRVNLANSGQYTSDGSALPLLATDALKLIFNASGIADEDIDIPPSPIRLFPGDGTDGLMIEPQTDLAELAVRICHDYLGSYLLPDPNAGTYGMWRVRAPQVPPYNILCAFDSRPPPAGRILNNINSYPPLTVPGGFANTGDSVPVFSILHGDTNWKEQRAEGNYVVAFAAPQDGGTGNAGLLTQVMFNYSSFNFPGGPNTADPNSVDWISRPVPIFQYLPGYAATAVDGAPNALNFTTRRVYDVACRGRETKTFTSQLGFVIDPTDAIVTGKRLPRFYDACLIWDDQALAWITGIILNCNPHYEKDDHQMMTLQIQKNFLN